MYIGIISHHREEEMLYHLEAPINSALRSTYIHTVHVLTNTCAVQYSSVHRPMHQSRYMQLYVYPPTSFPPPPLERAILAITSFELADAAGTHSMPSTSCKPRPCSLRSPKEIRARDSVPGFSISILVYSTPLTGGTFISTTPYEAVLVACTVPAKHS